MIRFIEIEGLRGISKGFIGSLGQVNIFLGKNGSGKSTVLEAIYIASACLEPKDPILGVDKLDYVISRRGGSGSWSSARDTLWFSMDTERAISISMDIDGTLMVFKVFNAVKDVLLELMDEEVKNLRASMPGFAFDNAYRFLSLTSRRLCRCNRNEVSCISMPTSVERIERVSLLDSLRDTLFIDSRMITRLRAVERSCWSRVVAKRLDKRIVEMLREEFEVDAEGLTYIPLGSEYVLALQLSTTSVRVDDLGDGAKAAIVTGLAMLAHKPKVLLLEEPENHMHPAGLETYMRFVLELAKEMSTQVFISSHSIELVKIVRKVCSDLGLELALYFLERSQSGELDARRLSAIDSEVLEKLGIDPRFLYAL